MDKTTTITDNATAMKAIHVLPMIPILLTACAVTQPTAQVRDGVYDKPVYEPVAAAGPVNDTPDQSGDPRRSDDYYDPSTASQYQRGYYDMAYNDPYYYNYGRFGFGMGLGYGSTWGSPYGSSYWGMNYGWPYDNGWGSGYGNGWGSPYGGGYGSPYGGYGWNDPWYGNAYGYNGYGYYGAYGNCYGCYQPVIICGNAGTVHGHRPTMGGGGGSSGTGGGSAMQPPSYGSRSMVSLRPAATSVRRPVTYSTISRPPSGGSDRSDQERPARPLTGTREARPVERGGDRGHGTDISTPSRPTGGNDGGSRPTTGHRPR